MSAVWLKLITILFLSCTALSGPGSSGVVWRSFGETITIQCRPPHTDKAEQEYLSLKKGLSEDIVLYREINSKNTIAKEFTGRLQLNGAFPDVDILIKNLTSDDMGPYWCEYKRFDKESNQQKICKGTGSVLLVMTDTTQKCETSDKNLVLVSVVISATVLIGIVITGVIILIIFKTKTRRTTVKPRRVATNDVYEDMRGTLRR